MEIQKITFAGVIMLLPITAGLAVATGLLYREADKNRTEVSELKRTVLSLHGMAIPVIPSTKKPEGSQANPETGQLPAIPAMDVKMTATDSSRNNPKKSSKGVLQQGGDRITLMVEDQAPADQQKPDVTLIGDTGSKD